MPILWVVMFIIGICFGFMISELLGRYKYGGNIVVTKSEGKTLYSLELNDYPEKIEFQKKVIFKVLVSDDESNRK